MATNESKYRACIDLVEAMYVENHTNERRIRTLLEFISNCVCVLDSCETINDLRRVEDVMVSLVHEAWNDPSAIDDCNDSLEMFNENKEDDDYVD